MEDAPRPTTFDVDVDFDGFRLAIRLVFVFFEHVNEMWSTKFRTCPDIHSYSHYGHALYYPQLVHTTRTSLSVVIDYACAAVDCGRTERMKTESRRWPHQHTKKLPISHKHTIIDTMHTNTLSQTYTHKTTHTHRQPIIFALPTMEGKQKKHPLA